MKYGLPEIPDFDDRPWDDPIEWCSHGLAGYCFDCVRERHNQEVLDGQYDDMDDDFASAPHPSAHYERGE